MPYLANAWYVAAWDDQVPRGGHLARKILDVNVLLLRDTDGLATAIPNRCSHRFAPLSLGSIGGGVIQCRYHGLEFNHAGQCTRNPHGDHAIPPRAHLTAFPLVERHRALWIWMGDRDAADPALIPDFGMVINDRLHATRRYLHPLSNYQLLMDNLLDLGHTAYLHADSLGSPAIVGSTRSVRRDGDDVIYELWAPDGLAPPFFQTVMPWYRDKHVDHWMVSTWRAPSTIQQRVAFAPAGQDRQGGDVMEGLHWLTPETEKSTHYFSAMARGFRRDEQEVDALFLKAGEKAFTQEDFPMLEAIQAEMGDADFWALLPAILSVDTGAVMARRILKSKLQKEMEARAAEKS